MQLPPPAGELVTELDAFAQALVDALSDPFIDWHWRPARGEWNLTEVACHLRDVEREVHQARFRSILTVENPFLAGATSDDWATLRNYAEQDGRTALLDFAAARERTVELLTRLDPADWERSGRHAFFGPSTLHELVHLAVQHDRVHWSQIRGLLEYKV
jgi:hypothetical protein